MKFAMGESAGTAHRVPMPRSEVRAPLGLRRDGSRFPMQLTVSDVGDSGRVRFIGVVRDLTPDHERAELQHRAAHDALTALPNRAYALEELRCRCERSARGGAVFAIAYLDLDHFKPINDNFGHQVGDDVLKVVARRLRNALGEQDFVARLGGDEFLLVVDGIDDRPRALRVVERARAATTQPIAVDGHSLRVGITAGIAIWGVDGKEPEALLQLADREMYRAKNGRR